jgi:RHS repeat-associated protein
MNASYSWMNNATLTDNAYQYNGKELNDDFGLNLNDYGARWYDGAVGRWWSVDNLTDDPNQINLSPYQYGWNNPANLTDPDGNCPTCPTAGAGFLIGGAVGGIMEIGSQLWDKGTVDNWDAVGGAAMQGAITGAVAGLTGGASLVVGIGASAGANVVGEQ